MFGSNRLLGSQAYIVSYGNLFCTNLNPMYANLCHLGNVIYKPFAMLWTTPRFLFYKNKNIPDWFRKVFHDFWFSIII